jgi:hypothetical protein
VSRQTKFEEELARIVRRANRLRAALAGDADIVKVEVKKCTVPQHDRVAHTRLVIQKRKK